MKIKKEYKENIYEYEYSSFEEYRKFIIEQDNNYKKISDVSLTNPLINKNGTLMISLEDLKNTFYFSTKESGENKINLRNAEFTMIITIGSKKINFSVSDNFVSLSEAPFIHNNNVYVPLRNVMEYFYHNVDYDKKTNSIILSDVFRLDEIVDIKNNYKVARPKTTYGPVKESKGEKFFTMITEDFSQYEDDELRWEKLTVPVDFYYTFGREYNVSLNSYFDELKIKNNAKYKKLSDDSYMITYDEYFDKSIFKGMEAYHLNTNLNNPYNKNSTLSKNMIFIKQEKDSVLFSSIKSDEYYLEQNYDYIYNILQTIQLIK